jgi:hypothetical protein
MQRKNWMFLVLDAVLCFNNPSTTQFQYTSQVHQQFTRSTEKCKTCSSSLLYHSLLCKTSILHHTLKLRRLAQIGRTRYGGCHVSSSFRFQPYRG